MKTLYTKNSDADLMTAKLYVKMQNSRISIYWFKNNDQNRKVAIEAFGNAQCEILRLARREAAMHVERSWILMKPPSKVLIIR